MKTRSSLARTRSAVIIVSLFSIAFLSTFAVTQTSSVRSDASGVNQSTEKAVLQASQAALENSSFSLVKFSPYTIQNSSVSMTISTELTEGVFTVAVLSPTNTRSELFDFADNLGKRSVKTSLEIPLSSFTPVDGLPGQFAIEIPVNGESGKSLIFGAVGVYPVAVSVPVDSKNVETQYSFISNVPNVGSSGAAYSQRLNVVPLIEFSPFVNRMAISNDENSLTEYGEKTRAQFSRAQNTIEAINSIDTPKSVVLSPEALETSTLVNLASPPTNVTMPLFPIAPLTMEYVPDTYTPINIAELQKQGVSRVYTDLLTIGRSQITRAGYGSTARTLVTQSVTPESIEMIARSGIDHVIVDDTTFSRNQRPSNQIVTLTQKSAIVHVGIADTSISTHLSSDLSPSAQANYLLAATTVVTLESPSVARGLILPMDISQLDEATVTQFLQGTINNPLIAPVNSQDYFAQLKPNKSASSALAKADYPANVATGFDKEQFASVSRFSGASLSMFDPATQQFSHASWMNNGVYSRTDRKVDGTINPAAAQALTFSVEEYIALPEKRTLTITSRENKIPVTIKNTSGSPISVVIQIDSDKLAFPEGKDFPVVLDEQNTTVQIPVKARTSGSFPVNIQIISPEGSVLVAQQKATVRSTVVSGAGIAIAVGAALFLALWWGSHIRKSRKKPLAPVIELPHEIAG